MMRAVIACRTRSTHTKLVNNALAVTVKRYEMNVTRKLFLVLLAIAMVATMSFMAVTPVSAQPTLRARSVGW